MDLKQFMPKAISSEELMQAQAEIWCLSYGYIKSAALCCAVKLGIPDAIHRSGGAATLPDLIAALSLPEAKRTHLSRLMRLLVALRIFTEEQGGEAAAVYRLTPVSLLLVHDAEANGGACMSRVATSAATLPTSLMAYLRLDEWFKSAGGGGAPATETTTPFMMAYGVDYWAAASRDPERNAFFNELMGSDSRLVAKVVVRECGDVFQGMTSLVDVGGGNGTMARAIARAFPHVRCSVLDLPHVVESVPPGVDGATVEFVAGDMMDSIPPADAVLLKNVLHDWSDEECIRILKRCREAISANGPEGKVVIIDMVVGGSSSMSKEAYEAQLLMDMFMMVLATGKERGEETWSKIFMDAGFTRYKIRSLLGARSVIEVYP
ncbi:unnamed protein product [Urochloa humidicola]